MKLRGIDFGHVWIMSGANGFYKEGYPYHQFWRPFGLRFEGSTFVSKTTTLPPREGNMPLGSDGVTPEEFKPKCIWVNPLKGIALNAVGLSGPGARSLLYKGIWQSFRDPWVLSFMSVQQSKVDRLDELRRFVDLLGEELWRFHGKMVFQQNFTCPNTEVTSPVWSELVGECHESFEIVAPLNLPQVPKLSVLIPVSFAKRIMDHPDCDGITNSNTVKFGELAHRINWEKLIGNVSPLARFGGGGLSGKELLPLVIEWVSEARSAGIEKPINAGGGILHPNDVAPLAKAGASSVAIGSITMLRPWRVQPTIRRANQLGLAGAFHVP